MNVEIALLRKELLQDSPSSLVVMVQGDTLYYSIATIY